jgi:hypothetical protein
MMFAFNRPILLMSIRAQHTMCNASLLKETMEFFIFTSPVSLHGDDFLIKLAFNKSLEINEDLINIRTLF